MAFDLAEKLAAVSKLNTGAQPQIEYLPFALVEPDPGNFYSLERIDELADSIATVGLLDPIRVRPSGERYTITSGHRRRAAIQLLIDSGEEHWREALPCIVDRGEATAEFRELQLIYANSATRHLSSSELSRQAERVEALLVALKGQGYDFPGRMQEHVAQAMSVNASKLKRLHAIRSNAQEYVLDAYDKGKINESVAYELQKLPRDAQKTFIVARHHACLRLDVLTAEEIRQYDEMQSKIKGLRCTASEARGSVWDKHPLCPISQSRLEEALRQINGYIPADGYKHPIGTKGNCLKGKCCRGCPELLECEVRCVYTDGEVTAREEQERAWQEQAEAARQQRQEAFDRDRQEMADHAAALWVRIRKAADAAQVDLRQALEDITDPSDLDQMISFARGEAADTNGDVFDLLDDFLLELADALHCSTDYLLERTDDPQPTPQRDAGGAVLCTDTPRPDDKPTAPAATWPTEWQIGTPDKEGWYAVHATWRGDGLYHEQLYWRGAWWEDERCKYTDKETTVLRFFPLPEVDEEGMK